MTLADRGRDNVERHERTRCASCEALAARLDFLEGVEATARDENERRIVAERRLAEAQRLMRVAVDGYKAHRIMSSDKTGYLDAIGDMQTFLKTADSADARIDSA